MGPRSQVRLQSFKSNSLNEQETRCDFSDILGPCFFWHSCKVICAFVESSDSKVREMAKKELQPLIDGGIIKIPETKQTVSKEA